MRKFIAGTILILAIATATYSQTASIKGTVTDTVEKKNLSNSVVSLLKPVDSILVKFTRCDKDGHFSLTSLKEGKYIFENIFAQLQFVLTMHIFQVLRSF